MTVGFHLLRTAASRMQSKFGFRSLKQLLPKHVWARLRCRQRNRMEIMPGRLKDWQRVTTRHDKSPLVFLSSVALTKTVILWL
ncbi:hypothetical protein SAMN04488026_103743 [Aliiruegeria lutimaris]|uniref:Transposase DDE domain-containing protein n=1 Tax=Aliiruegeria lutimaris TaxID=571298 RepID=A0A1G9AYM7_9RHOB|nr:hypothetical protein SAMN04488026_103743 [Aliiruegeria lutimaris]